MQVSRQAGKEKVMKTFKHKIRQPIPHKLNKIVIMCYQNMRKNLIFASFCGLFVCFMKSQTYKMFPLSFLGQIKHSVNEVLPNLWMYEMNWFSIPTRGLYYKTFYGHNLRICVKSYNFCPWQVFPTLSNVCG